jgi:hypothetical protein
MSAFCCLTAFTRGFFDIRSQCGGDRGESNPHRTLRNYGCSSGQEYGQVRRKHHTKMMKAEAVSTTRKGDRISISISVQISCADQTGRLTATVAWSKPLVVGQRPRPLPNDNLRSGESVSCGWFQRLEKIPLRARLDFPWCN